MYLRMMYMKTPIIVADATGNPNSISISKNIFIVSTIYTLKKGASSAPRIFDNITNIIF